MEEYIIDHILNDLSRYLQPPRKEVSFMRLHTKQLETLDDISFTLNICKWYRQKSQVLDNSSDDTTLIDIVKNEGESQIQQMIEESKKWHIRLKTVRIEQNHMHIKLERSCAFEKAIKQCLTMKERYGVMQGLHGVKVEFAIDEAANDNTQELNLTSLRLSVLQRVLDNLIEMHSGEGETTKLIKKNLSCKHQGDNVILCGAVTNMNGTKDTNTLASELYKKRSTDLMLMAEHKYGLRMKSSKLWIDYFEKLGKAAVTIELLQNKTNKNVKISLNNLSSTNKGSAFIFYNCARLATLFRDFEKKIIDESYPKLPPLDEIDFSLLTQPEEWELLFVFVMQYPVMLKNSLRDIEKGDVNPHNLVSYLSRLSSAFSAYYRRVRILVAPKPHLTPTIHARIYLLKAVEQNFHRTLGLLDIEPIKEM